MKRQITIYESAQNGKITVFNDVECNTLGELKQLLDEKGINYSGMEFIEGVTNTKLLSDDSRIPTDIPFKGKTTNNVFFNILKKDSKISSGVDYYALSRKDLMAVAKPFSQRIKEDYGKSYTQVSTAALAEWMYLNADEDTPASPEETPEEAPAKEEKPVAEAIVTMVKTLGLEKEVYDALGKSLGKNDSVFSAEDIAGFINRS